MEEFDKLFEEFSKLGLDAKRNAYSEEFIKISLILKLIMNKFGADIIVEPYNYKSNIDNKMKETELLNINYQDLYYLKTELLMLLDCLNSKKIGEN